MPKKQKFVKDPEQTIRRFANKRFGDLLSFRELTSEDDLGFDELAEAFLELDRAAGANVQHVNHDEDEVLLKALPEALQMRFRRYVDDIQDLELYYAEAGYVLGLEIGRRMCGVR